MAGFKTGNQQSQIVISATVTAPATGTIHTGTLVVVTPAVIDGSGNVTTPAKIVRATTLAVATHIIAQSDMTMEYGHIPVEHRDYRYVPIVAASATAKKVSLYAIIDRNDIVLARDGTDIGA